MNQQSQLSSTSSLTDIGALRVAVVSASWHKSIINNAVTAIEGEFAREGFTSSLTRFEVPGAFEIPLHAKRLAQSGQYDAIIACGLVVDGGIYRHEFVASAVIDGLMQVQLTTDVPVFSAVLTPHHFHEHSEHLDYFAKHFVIKGKEVARACLATVASLKKLR